MRTSALLFLAFGLISLCWASRDVSAHRRSLHSRKRSDQEDVTPRRAVDQEYDATLERRDYWERLVGTPSRLALTTVKEGVLPVSKYSMTKFEMEPFQVWLREYSLLPKVDSNATALASGPPAAAETSGGKEEPLPKATSDPTSAAGASSIPPPPLSYVCGVFYSPQYKFIFVRNRKTASSTFLTAVKKFMLERGLCNQTKTDGTTLANTCVTRMDPEELEAEGVDVAAMWREYLVITSSRNPWARAASGYQFTFDKWQRTEGACAQPTFPQFCRDPFIMGKLSNLYNCVTQREGVGSRHEGHWNFDFCHVEPAAPCMLDDGGKLVVDFVIRYERLYADMQAAVDLINARRAPGLPAIEISSDVKWRNKGSTARAYDINSTDEAAFVYADKYRLCGRDCVDTLAGFYASDLKVFGWDWPPPPPPLSEYAYRPLRPMLGVKPPSGRYLRKARLKAKAKAVDGKDAWPLGIEPPARRGRRASRDEEYR